MKTLGLALPVHVTRRARMGMKNVLVVDIAIMKVALLLVA